MGLKGLKENIYLNKTDFSLKKKNSTPYTVIQS